MRRIAVTGASGFLGQRLAAILLQRGFNVRAIYRRAVPPEQLAELAAMAPATPLHPEIPGLELRRADLAAPCPGIFEGCDAVVHAAALASDWGRWEDFHKANVDATAAVIEGARRAGASHLVFISSLSVMGFGRHDMSTEEGPYFRLKDLYPRSKLDAERLVQAAASQGFGATILRLGYVFGPGDRTSTWRMFEAARRGSFGWIGSGWNRTSMVHVDDACDAIIASLENPGAGVEDPGCAAVFSIVGDETITWREFSSFVCELAVPGSGVRPRHLPAPAAWCAAAVLGALSRFMALVAGRERSFEPPLTPYRIRRSTVEYTFSNEKAKLLLGFRPEVGIREGLERARDAWLGERGAG
jgi:nucleoside-diphosphate-sugar epimerase